MTKRRSRGTRSLLEEMGALDFSESSVEIAAQGTRVVNIVLDRIRPDPAQPRRVLPESIRHEFLTGTINARQALEQWESMVAEEVAQRGRPRPDWMALLSRNPDDRAEDVSGFEGPGLPGPEEDSLRAIVSTAATIRHGGQVSPITVSEVEGGSSYRIETGERRYWAHHWLNAWLGDGFDQIQCIVVEGASPWRQAAENTSREGLTAMAMARQLATLLLDLYDIHPDYTRPIPNDWYRQALDYRVPRGEGPNLRAALGGMERAQFSRLQALLRLPDPVWDLADRNRLEEKHLRYVLKVDDVNLQLQLVRAIIDMDLNAEQVRVAVESGRVSALFGEGRARNRRHARAAQVSEQVANRWSTVARQVPKADLELVADQWIKRQKPDEIRKQVAVLRRLLEIVEQRVDQ